jgi:hypothetical protein
MFKLAALVYRRLHGPAPRRLARQLRQVADMPSRRLSDSIRPPRASRLLVIARFLPLHAARAQNGLTDDVTAAQTTVDFSVSQDAPFSKFTSALLPTLSLTYGHVAYADYNHHSIVKVTTATAERDLSALSHL